MYPDPSCFTSAIDLGQSLTLKPLAEVVYLAHEGGGPEDAAAASAALEIDKEAWSISIAGSVHERVSLAAATDRMLATDIGRNFESPQLGKFKIDIGYRISQIGGHANAKGTDVELVGSQLAPFVFN